MSQKRVLTRRLHEAITSAAEARRTTYRHPDGSTLSLPDRVLISHFLALDDQHQPALSPEATRFLAECEITGGMSDLEASVIATCHSALAEPNSPSNPQPHSGPDRLPTPTLTLPHGAPAIHPTEKR